MIKLCNKMHSYGKSLLNLFIINFQLINFCVHAFSKADFCHENCGVWNEGVSGQPSNPFNLGGLWDFFY